MLKKIFFAIFSTIIAISAFLGLFYLRNERDSNFNQDELSKYGISRPIMNWQKITTTITEERQKVVININVPKVIISGDYFDLGEKINKAITRRVESLKKDFIFAVNMVADDNGEINTLDIDTEALLVTPRLVSFAFTATKHLVGVKDGDSERTFLVFDLAQNGLILEGNELFNDDSAWAKAVKKMKTMLLAQYLGNPNCDFMFAPQQDGFAVSCVGIDFEDGGVSMAVAGDIHISKVQEFVRPSALSHILLE